MPSPTVLPSPVAPRATRPRRPLVSWVLLFTCAAVVSACGVRTAAAQPFTELNTGLAAPPFPCAVWGDYDGDGDLDLLVAGLGRRDVAFTTLYRNDGGTFTDSGVALLGLSRAAAAWGDFDGDGDLDLAMTGLQTNGLPATRVYRNDGAGVFTVVAGSFLGVLAGSVAWGDADGDGDLDLLVTGVTSTVAGVGVASTRLYRNDAGTFTSVPHPFPNCYVGSVAWGDYNGDGRLDVVIAGSSENGALFAGIFRNDGNGAFTDIGAGLPGDDLGPAVWGDFDNDGDLDLLFGGNSTDGFITRIYRNDHGAFTDVNAGLLPTLWSSAGWADFDGDGDLDLMTSGYDAAAQLHRAILYRNDGGTFVATADAVHNVILGTLSWADYDNDGDPDLLLAGNENGADLVSLYRNDSPVHNARPGAPTALAAHFTATDAALSWSPGTDDHTPAAGLSYNVRIGTTPGGSQIVSAESGANGFRRVPALGNASSARVLRVNHLQPGITYYWSVQSIDPAFLGSPFAAEASFTYQVGAVGDAPVAAAGIHALPNPFVTGTTVTFALPAATRGRLGVYDVTGRLVQTLWDGGLGQGPHRFAWDGHGAGGAELPTGIYLVRFESAGVTLRAMTIKRR